MLHEVGFMRLRDEINSLNFSYGTEIARHQRRNLAVQLKHLKPYLLNMQVVSLSRFDMLYDQVLSSLAGERFCGVSFLYTIWGQKQAYEQEGGSQW
jgi:hypothetical protein